MPNVVRLITRLSELQGTPEDIGAEALVHKNQPNGYAGLDAEGNLDPTIIRQLIIIDGGSANND